MPKAKLDLSEYSDPSLIRILVRSELLGMAERTLKRLGFEKLLSMQTRGGNDFELEYKTKSGTVITIKATVEAERA